jgi:hypothetical protein
MQRITAVLTAAAVAVSAAIVVAQAKPTFAGKWVVDASSAPAAPSAPAGPGGGGGRGGRGGMLGQELTITQDATTLTIEYMGGGQNPAPVKLVYKLDGTESKNTMMMRGGQMEQVSKATWAGNALAVTTTMMNGEQKRTFALEGGNLVVETANPGREGGPGMTTKVTYKKAA